jgi:thioesterase domain-containing protein
VADVAPQTLYPRPHLQGDYVAPRNQIEATLVQLLERLLGIELIGIYDNFFDLGGDSFLAVQLVNQLHNHFQTGIFLHHIIEAPTVARLAILLQTLAERTRQGLETYRSPLVALKPNGNRRPLFCVHPAGGTVLCYLDLARHLDPDQPLYGLQAPTIYGGPHHETIEAAASCYLDVVRGVQPHGPYLLSGMSYGGNVAFEMARQLHQQGEETNLLALFDSYPPVAYHNLMPDPTEFLVAFPWIFGMFLGPRQSPPFTFEDLRRRDPQEQLAYVFERITEARLFPLNMAQQELGQFFEVWKAHHHALRYYDPPHQAYPNTITLFRAAEELPSELLSLLKIDLSGQIAIAGWKMLTSTPLQAYEVPGNHITMLVEPHVQILAKHLNACLTRLEEGSTQHER